MDIVSAGGEVIKDVMAEAAVIAQPPAPLSAAEAAKPFWASQTIWSSLGVVGASACGAVLAWNANDINAFGVAVVALLGGIGAIVGRFRATGPVK